MHGREDSAVRWMVSRINRHRLTQNMQKSTRKRTQTGCALGQVGSVGHYDSMDLGASYSSTKPQEILLKIPPPRDPQQWNEEKDMELVIDEAGKVRSARMQGEPYQSWIDTSAGLKYIPAFKDRHPKVFRLRSHVQRDR